MPPSIALHDSAHGADITIVAIHAGEELASRLRALGFRVGRRLRVIRRAPLGGPIHVRLNTTDVMLRAADARAIEVAPAA